MKNLLGNWEIAPVYIYQTGSLVTPQSQTDANLMETALWIACSSIPEVTQRWAQAPGRLEIRLDRQWRT